MNKFCRWIVCGGFVNAPPGSGEGIYPVSFEGGFLGLFGALLRSGFGALLLAAVLGELPAFGFQEVLGMLLAIFGFPIVTAQLALDDNLLALLSQRSEALAGTYPTQRCLRNY